MKYLKHIFESTDKEILQDLKDICLELEDIGYWIDIEKGTESRIMFVVNIRKRPDFIVYRDIEDCIERMKYYMSLEGYKMWIWVPSSIRLSNGYRSVDWINSTNTLSFQKLEHQIRITFSY